MKIKWKNKNFTSPIASQIQRYLQFKYAAGCKYHDEKRLLYVLDEFLESHLSIEDPIITDDIVREYSARKGTESEANRAHRLSILRQLCRFLAPEEPRTAVDSQYFLGIHRRPFVPYILTLSEGQRLLQSCLKFSCGKGDKSLLFHRMVYGTALMLLYLTGMRVGEVLALNLEDVDLATGVLRIRQAKFGKSRFVPIAPDLTEAMRKCRSFVDEYLYSRPPNACFFPKFNGKTCTEAIIRYSFRKTLTEAGIVWLGQGKGPRLHDLRHSFAVNRMILWYRQNANLNAKLPLLATYLGHVSLSGTQRYLRLTETFVGEITRRHQTQFGYLITERISQ